MKGCWFKTLCMMEIELEPDFLEREIRTLINKKFNIPGKGLRTGQHSEIKKALI
jgi:hypothetical protein